MTEYLQPIYTDIRAWLLSMFPTAPVVQGYQNAVPIPIDAIMMTFMLERRLDQLTVKYSDNHEEAAIQQSVQGTMQLDFFGEDAHARSTEFAAMWQTVFTADQLTACQPLYCSHPKNMTFVNEQGFYEPRYMVELELQYNVSYEKSINGATSLNSSIVST